MDAETKRRLLDILAYLDEMQEVFDLPGGLGLCQWGACLLPAVTELRALPASPSLRVCAPHEALLMRGQELYQMGHKQG